MAKACASNLQDVVMERSVRLETTHFNVSLGCFLGQYYDMEDLLAFEKKL